MTRFTREKVFMTGDDYPPQTTMSLARVVKAAAPFVAVLFVFLILVTYIPMALNLVTDLGDGAGDHCKIRSLTGVGMIYHAGFVIDEVTHEFISNRCFGR